MRIKILGSGTLLPDPRRGAPAHWVEADGEAILVDCGAGALGAMARLGLRWRSISHILLTHYHTDHVGGLAPLFFALKHGMESPRREPLSVLGPEGLGRHLSALSNAHGDYMTDPGFPLVVEEVRGGGPWSSTEGVFRILGYPTNHTENSIAYRLETRHGSAGFTGDTGPDPRLGSFMEGVDLLVAECSHPDGNGLATHLTPASLSEIAGAASPRLLVNVHAYPPLDPETVPDLLWGAGYGGRVAAGWDGMGIQVTGEGTLIEEGSG